MKKVRFIRLHVHAETITAVVAEPGKNREVRFWGSSPTDMIRLKVIRKAGRIFTIHSAVIPGHFMQLGLPCCETRP